MKTLVIAEKPSVARDIVGALPGSFDEHKNFYESDDYVVTFAVGHLLELSDPEDYDPAWKSWKLDNLPIIPTEFKVRPRDKKSATQLNLVHKLLKRKDVDRVVNACDAGREGELIFTHIYETSGVDKPVDRLWINSMTKAAIREGFEKLRPADQLEPLRDAARSRSEADWLVGMNATRAAPPPRYTEATLLSGMETAGKLVDDEELREAMKERGLGTPATRAEIIETLIRREYVERAGKDLQPTPKGMSVVTMLEEHPITSAELTGDWEKQLSDIEHGNGDRAAFMQGIAGFAEETVDQIRNLDDEKIKVERVELGLCPKCGAETGEIIKENSRAYGCTSWKSREEPGCGFVIWKRVAGRTLTPEIARQLLEEGRTREVLSGFRSRNGKPFRARLVLNDEGKTEFEFPARTETVQPTAAE